MILLGIDTCGAEATVALAQVDTSGALARIGSAALAGRNTAAMLTPALRKMLEDARLAPVSIEGIIVVDGPGSFTGIRIGVSTAKALGEALGVPLFAISRLRVLVEVYSAGGAILDAGRGEFYFGSIAGAGGRDEIEECLLNADELADRMPAGTAPVLPLIACEAKVASAVPQARLVAPPTAFEALRAALPDVPAGRSADVSALDGRYIRRSDLYAQTAKA